MSSKTLHKDITELDLHEVKGASAASLDQIMFADGAGSTLWRDSTTISSKIDSLAFVLKQGSGATGPVTFGTADAVFQAMDETRDAAGGEFVARLVVDDTSTAQATLPGRAEPYNFDGVVVEGIYRPGGFGVTSLRIEEGARFINGPFEYNRIFVDNAAATVSPVATEKYALYSIGDGADISNSGTVPMFETSTFAPYDYFSINLERGSIGNGLMNNAVFDLGSNALLLANIHNGAIFNSESLAGGALTAIYRDVRQNGLYSTNHPLFSGSQVPFVFYPPRFKVNPVAHTGPATIETRTALSKADVSGGGFTLTLPRIKTGPYNIAGYSFWIKEVSGSGGLLAAPSAGDTIDGAATSFPISGGTTQLFMPDTEGNWTTL